MFRGRGGPRQATPANVQCQKCLKRGHYSYECKESSAARPYVSRPSRTQQLLNPKLVPKLTNDKPEELMRKKGVADEELAKKEAERAKKRALDKDLDAEDGPSRRLRSASFDSVSTVSTRRSSATPPPRRRSPSPPPRARPISRSMSPEANYERSQSPPRRRSPSPPARTRRSLSRDSLSPPRHRERRYRERSVEHGGRTLSRSPGLAQDDRHPRRSRSPVRSGGGRPNGRLGGRREGDRRGDGPPARQEAPRERSLSPFSKRVALTQSRK